MIHVLDACAMIALLKSEAGHDVITASVSDPGITCIAHAVNMMEVYYIIGRKDGPERAGAAITRLGEFGVQVREDFDQGIWRQAAEHMIGPRIAQADCIAAALAARLGGVLVTGDYEIERLKEAGVCTAHFFRTRGPKENAVSIPLPAAAHAPTSTT